MGKRPLFPFSRITILAMFMCCATSTFGQRQRIAEIQDTLSRFESLSSEEKGSAITALQEYIRQFRTPEEKAQLRREIPGIFDRTAESLEAALSDGESEDVQQRALGTIQLFGDALDPRDRVVLKIFESDIRRILQFSQDIEMKKSAVNSFRVMPTINTQTVDALVMTAGQNEPYLLRSTLSTLSLASRNQPEIVNKLLPFFSDDRAEVRHIIVGYAGIFPDLTPEVMGAVRRCLTDEDARVRRAAIRNFTNESFATLAQPEDRGKLTDIIRNTNEPMDVRVSAVLPLQRIAIYQKDSELLQDLRGMATDVALPHEIRRHLIERIGSVEGYSPGTREFLEQLLTSSEPEVVSAAQQGIRNIDRHWERRRQ